MRFTFSAVLALGSIAGYSDAFLSPTLKMRTTAIGMDQAFMDALSPGSSKDDNGDGEEKNEDGSSSRFQEMMKLAQQSEPAQRAIENPFLNPPASAPAPTQSAANPDELTVEEQARMFREMMAANQSPAPAAAVIEPPKRTSKTDRAGRPVGRNVDADKIANTSDLYFAQLKRDSTVRTMGRIRGDEGVAGAVFEDEGIRELDGLLAKNPYLQGQRDEELELLNNLPDEIVKPYFESSEVPEDIKASSGISYKQRLMERRQKSLGGGSVPPPPAPKQEIVEEPTVEVTPPPPVPVPVPVPEPVVPQASTPPPPPPVPEPEPEPVVIQASTPPPPPPAPVVETPRQITVTSSADVRKQNIRTLMGLTLKHRGGQGFGKGRLKGQDIDLFEGLVEEITNMLRDEAQFAPPVVDTTVSATVEASSTTVAEPVPVQAAAAVPANIDSTIACIEGAITMYKNSPPAIQESVLGVLRAALMSAVDTCNIALAQPAPAVAASADASIDGMVACIEGAVTMYKNCPPALQESVLVTLRMALMSAVETCDLILSPNQVAPPAPPAATATAATPSSPVSPPSPATGTDPNSKALEKIYEKVQAASGDGKLGLRSDLTAAEANELADELVEMRGILMEELEGGIPDPYPSVHSSDTDTATSAEPSTTSRYQQMLAKARAEKAQ